MLASKIEHNVRNPKDKDKNVIETQPLQNLIVKVTFMVKSTTRGVNTDNRICDCYELGGRRFIL